MSLRYSHPINGRRQSTITTENKSIFTPLSLKPHESTATVRFFGASSSQPRFAVKQPDPNSIKNDKDGKIIAGFTESYRHEQAIWNLVYPDQKAELFTEGGLRLVLPFLPGEPASECLSDDPLTRCQQVLAVVDALIKFKRLGFYYGDFNSDNVLIEKKPDGSFKAYLIDFESVHKSDHNPAHWTYLNSFVYSIPSLRTKMPDGGYRCFKQLTKDLLEEIQCHVKNQPSIKIKGRTL